jgi:hypothetical protein
MLCNDSVDFSLLKVDHIDFPSLPNFATDKLNEGIIIDIKCGLKKWLFTSRRELQNFNVVSHIL